ncbi:hypothetical protein COT20_02800, partial [bacterium (Candidatus Gribaldobacteria) CG08_land_8_20_14_0_20_39_15]
SFSAVGWDPSSFVSWKYPKTPTKTRSKTTTNIAILFFMFLKNILNFLPLLYLCFIVSISNVSSNS